jgi:hypothetical protein
MLSFPPEILARTLRNGGSRSTLIDINQQEFVALIISYAATLVDLAITCVPATTVGTTCKRRQYYVPFLVTSTDVRPIPRRKDYGTYLCYLGCAGPGLGQHRTYCGCNERRGRLLIPLRRWVCQRFFRRLTQSFLERFS